MILVTLAVKVSTEHLVEGRVFVAEVLLGQHVSLLKAVNEDDTEGQSSADQEDSDVHQVQVGGNVCRVTLVGQARDLINTHHTESEENRSKADVHEISNPIDYLVKPLTEFVTDHQGHSQKETDCRGKNCIPGENDTHANLRLVTRRVDVRVRRQMDNVLLVQDLL